MIGRAAATRAIRVTRWRGDAGKSARDTVAVEEPLEIRVAWVDASGASRSERLAVTMRTPGDDFDLVAGFLHGEAIVDVAADILELTYCRDGDVQEYNVVEARLRPGAHVDVERMRRNVFVSSSCGVCGKASLEAVEATGCRAVTDDGVTLAAHLVSSLPDRLLQAQSVFERTGGLHAAGLFDAEGELLVTREDVGRHNAVDKVVGSALLARPPHVGAALVVSGRASFELVQKAVRAEIPVLVAVETSASCQGKRLERPRPPGRRSGGR